MFQKTAVIFSLEKIEVKESRNRNSDAALGKSSRISKCFKKQVETLKNLSVN